MAVTEIPSATPGRTFGLKRTGKYVNGERDGVWYDYYDTGELFLTTLYKDGKEIRWNNYKIDY